MVAVRFEWFNDDKVLRVVRQSDGVLLRMAEVVSAGVVPSGTLYRVVFTKVEGRTTTNIVPRGYETTNLDQLRRMAREWAEDPSEVWLPRELVWSQNGDLHASVRYQALDSGDVVPSDRAARIFRMVNVPEDHPKPWRIELEDYTVREGTEPYRSGWQGGRTLYGWDQPTRAEAEAIAEEWVRDGVFRWEDSRDLAHDAWVRRLAGESLRADLMAALGEGAEVSYSDRDGTFTATFPAEQARALTSILRGLRKLAGAD